MTTTRKTKLMRSVEEAYGGEPLETLLVRLYNERGLPGMAEETGISKGNLWYWMVKLHIEPQRVAVPEGYRIALVPLKKRAVRG